MRGKAGKMIYAPAISILHDNKNACAQIHMSVLLIFWVHYHGLSEIPFLGLGQFSL